MVVEGADDKLPRHPVPTKVVVEKLLLQPRPSRVSPVHGNGRSWLTHRWTDGRRHWCFA